LIMISSFCDFDEGGGTGILSCAKAVVATAKLSAAAIKSFVCMMWYFMYEKISTSNIKGNFELRNISELLKK
ncbi:hypothetical protein ABTK74_20495, partial [Acinetobacter baumannii]